MSPPCPHFVPFELPTLLLSPIHRLEAARAAGLQRDPSKEVSGAGLGGWPPPPKMGAFGSPFIPIGL